MKKNVHFTQSSNENHKSKHHFKSANKKSIDSIKSIIEKAEQLLSEQIDEEEKELSQVKKKIVLDIKLEKQPDPNPYPLTKISKRNYQERFENQRESSQKKRVSRLKSQPNHLTQESQKVKQNESLPYSNEHVKEQITMRTTSAATSNPFRNTPDYIDEVGVTGEIIKTYELDFDYCEAAPVQEEYLGHGMKRIVYRNGDVSFVYKNGSRKTNHNGVLYSFFANGDKMQEFPDGTTSYKYAENGAIEITYTNGDRVIFFVNGQVHHFTHDGRIRVTFPDGKSQVHYDPSLIK